MREEMKKETLKRSSKKDFLIRVTYFKESGKYYTEAEFIWNGAGCGPDGSTCYMNDVAAHVRGLLQSGGQGSLPGLSTFSSGWDGPILLDSPDGYPVLINLPRVQVSQE